MFSYITTTQVHNERNVINPNLKGLSWGPNSKTTSCYMYFINGYKFHTNAWDNGKKTTNSVLYVKGVTDGGEDDFYGSIHYIYELEYVALNKKISLFYYEWFDSTINVGTRFHSQYNLVVIKLSGRYGSCDPLILPQKVRQVYYASYPNICKNLCGWYVPIKTQPRGYVQVDNINDELSYQAYETTNMLRVTRIEHLQCLVDTSNVEVVDDDDDDIEAHNHDDDEDVDLLNEDYSENHIDNDDSEFDNNDD